MSISNPDYFNQICEDATANHHADAMIILALMWHKGYPFFNRSDIYQSFSFLIEAQINGSKDANQLLKEMSDELEGFDASQEDKLSDNLFKCLVRDAEKGNWIAQTRLGIILFNDRKEKDKAKDSLILRLLEEGKKHDCEDAIYCIDIMTK